MTSYTLLINNVERDFTGLKTQESVIGNTIHQWNATLAYPSESISLGQDVEIKRDAVSMFKGILETIDPTLTQSGAFLKVSGRHTKVKLYRKWSERYADEGGFWTNYYPNKIVSFLLNPSFSEKPTEVMDTYRRIGWGIDPRTWDSITASGTDSDYDVMNVGNRLPTLVWRCDTTQANGEYIQIKLGSSTTICGIRIENRGLSPQHFVRNYKIETSTTGAWGGEEVEVVSEVTNNRAINIVENWTPAATQWIRITCTATFADSWDISDIFIYESDGAISGISEGTLTEHLPLNCSKMSANAASGQAEITVKEGWRFSEKDDVVVGDDNAEEYRTVSSVTGNVITLTANLTNSYTTAANGLVLNLDRYAEVNLEYMRRTESINKIVELCTTDDVKWQWEVTDAGAVSMGARVGTDKSGSISFTYQNDIITSSNKQNNLRRVDRVWVLGGGKGDEQDRISSGWQGSGDYESVITDTSLKTEEACIAKAKALLDEYDAPREVAVVVRDPHTTGDWELGDDVTLTDTITGLSGSYRVKTVNRMYSANGEIVSMNCDMVRKTRIENLIELYREMRDVRQTQDEYVKQGFKDYIDKTGFSLFYEGESLALDPSTSIISDSTASNEYYIKILSAESGNVWWGPKVPLAPGDYRALFKCKVTDRSGSSSLVTIDVYSLAESTTYNTRTLKPTDFDTNDTWQVMAFNFTITTEVTDLEFRANTFQTGITDFSCDWVGIAPNAIVDDPPGAPGTPANPAAAASLAGVRVTWDANTETDFSYYIVYKGTGADPTAEYKRTYTNYIYDNDVSYGTTYHYRVKAVDWAGNISDYSNSVNAAPSRVDPLDLDIEVRPWIADFNVDYTGSLPNITIRWGSASDVTADGEVTFSDGSTVTGINAGTQALTPASTETYWLYWDETQKTTSKYDIQLTDGTTADYDSAVGSGKGVLAVVQVYSDGTTKPTILLFNSYMPTITAGVIAANTITASEIASNTITASEIAATTITAAEIAATTITVDKISATWTITGKTFQTAAAGNNRVVINSSGVYGYNSSDVAQFKILASDGTAQFGGTVGTIDTSGITINNTGADVFVSFTVGGAARGKIYTDSGPATDIFNFEGTNADIYIQSTTDDITITAPSGIVSILTGGGDLILNPSGDVSIRDTVDLRANIIPDKTGSRDLGSTNKKFGDIWARDKIQGPYYSNLGTQGSSFNRTFVDDNGVTNTVTIESGLIVGWTQV